MNVNYKVFLSGERYAYKSSTGTAKQVLTEWVTPKLVNDALSELGRVNKVVVTDRRKGLKIVLTSTTKKVKVVRKPSTFLKVELDGRQSEAQILVAAVDKLKTSEGWHRVVCEVVANGLVYKVKCHHKGISWTDAVKNATIESKRAA